MIFNFEMVLHTIIYIHINNNGFAKTKYIYIYNIYIYIYTFEIFFSSNGDFLYKGMFDSYNKMYNKRLCEQILPRGRIK